MKMVGNPFAMEDVVVNQEEGYTIPEVGVSGGFGVVGNKVNAQVQLTGVLVIMAVIAVVVLSKKWPVVL